MGIFPNRSVSQFCKVISVLLGIVLIAFLSGCRQTAERGKIDLGKQEVKHKVKENTSIKVQPPTFSTKLDEKVSNITGYWTLKQQLTTKLGDDFYAVLGVYSPDNENAAKIVVEKYNKDTKRWLMIWDSAEINGFLGDPPFDNFKLVKSESGDKAIVAAWTHVGNKGSRVQVILIDKNGNVELLEDENAGLGSIEIKDNRIVIEGESNYGIHKIYFKTDKVAKDIIPRSKMNPAGATPAYFIIAKNDDYRIVPAKTNMIILTVGQSIAFIPSSPEAKAAFDDGSISIYTDAWNGGWPDIINSACELKSGNSYTFESTGVYHFVLDYSPINGTSQLSDDYLKDPNTIKPTFTVVVK